MNEILPEEQVIAFLIMQMMNVIAFVAMVFTLGVWWKHYEDARKTAGIATVLIVMFVGVPSGLTDLKTILIAFVTFAMAAGVRYATVYTQDGIKKRQQERKAVEVINGTQK